MKQKLKNDITVPYDLSQIGDDDLVVREEKVVSISWSRDNSPAPIDLKPSSTVSEVPPKTVAEEEKYPSERSTSVNHNHKLPPLDGRKSSSSHQEKSDNGGEDREGDGFSTGPSMPDKVDNSEKTTTTTCTKDKPRVRFVQVVKWPSFWGPTSLRNTLCFQIHTDKGGS